MFGWEFPPHKSGGLGTACHGLTKALACFPDVEVLFVVPKAWGDEDQCGITFLGADGIPVIRKLIQFPDMGSKVAYYEFNAELIPYLGTNEFNELKTSFSSGENRLTEFTEEGKIIFEGGYGPGLFQEIQRYALVAETIARELDFDVIHVHDWMTFPAGMAAKQISGKALVVHIHSTDFDRSGNQVNPLICAIEKEGMEIADKIIAVSDFTRNALIRNYHIDPGKVTTVCNAVEPFNAEFIHGRTKTGDEKIVTFLGRITMQKGPGYFMDAAARVLEEMKNVRFVMAGNGDMLNAMKVRAAELNIAEYFDFPGFLNDGEVPGLFRMSDVFVMPSVSEPFGIVALEAMQMEVPVIISKQSGVSEVLKNVLKVDYWDIRAMADAICKVLNDKVLRNNLIEKGKKEVGLLTWKNAASKVRAVYFDLLT